MRPVRHAHPRYINTTAVLLPAWFDDVGQLAPQINDRETV
jgi:hypothetical protein